MNSILERIESIGILPVVKIEHEEDAIPLAKALCAGGIDTAEITYRTPFATKAIQQIHEALPEMLVGAGTIRTIQQAKEAVEAGASFLITPGFNKEVVVWCKKHNVVIVPGVSTASEIEQAVTHGLTTLKFFPAQSSGGAKKLKDLAAPYSDIRFIPTGGINADNLHEYLDLPNVLAIGGSFMLKDEVIHHKQWDDITDACTQAIQKMLAYELIHIGINSENEEEATQTAQWLCFMFSFPYYKKPKSQFAGKGFEILNSQGIGEHGHIGIYTHYPMRAMYQLQKKGITFLENTITRNKKTNRINFVYLNQTIAGFGIHLINPDVKM